MDKMTHVALVSVEVKVIFPTTTCFANVEMYNGNEPSSENSFPGTVLTFLANLTAEARNSELAEEDV